MSTKQRRIAETGEHIAQRNFDQKNRMPRTCGPKIGHVRVCGGSGWVTARFYPATKFMDKILSKYNGPAFPGL
jgi:hypothetical protein